MAQHGSHKYEIKRNRIRNDLDDHGIPDKRTGLAPGSWTRGLCGRCQRSRWCGGAFIGGR
jgi:hypothetical protein